jgi:hypothetical protein
MKYETVYWFKAAEIARDNVSRRPAFVREYLSVFESGLPQIEPALLRHLYQQFLTIADKIEDEKTRDEDKKMIQRAIDDLPDKLETYD